MASSSGRSIGHYRDFDQLCGGGMGKSGLASKSGSVSIKVGVRSRGPAKYAIPAIYGSSHRHNVVARVEGLVSRALSFAPAD